MSTGERWVLTADQDGVRDKDGRVILPLIKVFRMEDDPSENMTALGVDVPRLQVAKLVSPKSTELSNLESRRPISQRSLNKPAVYDVYTVPYPSQTVVSYEVVVKTSYKGHMNSIREAIREAMDTKTRPSFKISLSADDSTTVRSGVGPAELKDGRRMQNSQRSIQDDHYVVGFLEGAMDDGGNTDGADQEQVYESIFRIKVPVALMLEPNGKPRMAQVERTAFKISLVGESVHIVSDPRDADRIFGRRR